MVEALCFREVAAGGWQEGVSFRVAAGTVAAIVTPRQQDSDLLVRLLLGLEAPAAGEVSTLGVELAGASAKALQELRRRVAVLHPSGGLVSNLKVWENLVLPLQYHGGVSEAELEERGVAALSRVGYAGRLMELPGHLSLHDRRLVGLARAILVRPRLVVHNASFGGLSAAEKEALVAAALDLHREEGATSLFLTPDPAALAGIPVQSRIILQGSRQ